LYCYRVCNDFCGIAFLPGFGGMVLIHVVCTTVWNSRNAAYGYVTLFGVGTCS
jgi:hypothetical protein